MLGANWKVGLQIGQLTGNLAENWSSVGWESPLWSVQPEQSMENPSLVSSAPADWSEYQSSYLSRHKRVWSHETNIRERCQSSHLSGDLALLSWREKSSKSYDSCCCKWVSWCKKWNKDPICGPISDVANFLANEGGYQYRSLNSYWSSISTTHDMLRVTQCVNALLLLG